MKQIIISGPFRENEQKAFCNLSPDLKCKFVKPQEVTAQMLSTAQALIGNVPPFMLADQPQLEWVQLTSSGADKYVHEKNISKDLIITTATGSYGVGIAEYMVAMLLSMMKKIPDYLDNQKNGVWADEGVVTTPYGKRVLIVGTGDIGLEFAKRMRAFGCKLVGIRRRNGICPEELDEVYSTEFLKEQLALADVVAVCLPGTKSTFHLFDEEMLSDHTTYYRRISSGSYHIENIPVVLT